MIEFAEVTAKSEPPVKLRVRLGKIQGWAISVIMFWLTLVRLHPKVFPFAIRSYWADAVVLLIGVLMLALPGTRFPKTRTARLVFGASLALLAGIVFSAGGAVIVSGLESAPITVSLLVHIFRYVYLVLVLLVLYLLVDRQKDLLRLVYGLTVWGAIVNAIIAVFQLLNPPLIGRVVVALWNDDKLRPLATGYPRVYGAFNNANWFGVFLAFCLTLWVTMFFYKRLRWSTTIGLTLLIIFLLIVSGSRTGMLAAGAGVMVSMLFSGLLRIRVLAIATAMITGLGFTLTYGARFVPALQRTIDRFTAATTSFLAGDSSQVDSVSGRLYAWSEAFEAFKLKPIFGYGSLDAALPFDPHNSFLTILVTAGLIGAAAVGVFIGVLVFVVGQKANGNSSADESIMRTWFFAFTTSLGVAFLAGDFIHTTQVMILWVFTAAATISIRNRIPRADPAS